MYFAWKETLLCSWLGADCLFARSLELQKRVARGTQRRSFIFIENTEKCYTALKGIANNDASFNENLLKQFHRTLLDRDNLNQDDIACYNVIPMGVFHRVPCYTRDKGHETRYCPAARIDTEMKFFFEQARLILNGNDIDPYRAAAHLHFLFARIHPFADGNGRIVRLVSSIPLLKEDLPPVVVSLEHKKKYLRALQKAGQVSAEGELQRDKSAS